MAGTHRGESQPGARTSRYGGRHSGRESDPPTRDADGKNRLSRGDDPLRVRQEAGLAALLGIASQVSFGVSEAATVVLRPVPSRPDEDRQADDHSVAGTHAATAEEAGRGRLGTLLTRLRTDHLVRNSLYLMLSSGVQAALGFTFWLIMARLFSRTDVGLASSLISATTLIGYFALFGLNSTLVRFLPTAEDRDRLISAALLLVIGTGAAIGLGYVLLTPVVASRLAFVERSPPLMVGFMILSAAAAVNVLTDSVFIAQRRAELCALTDGLIGGVGKIIFGLALAGTGAFGLFSASTGGYAASAVASIVLIVVVLRWRPSLRRPIQTLRPLLRFSGANYLANAFNLLPSVVVPLVVLDRLGPEPAAYYFVAFQMATLLYAAVNAVENAFLAEGSQADADWRAVRKRSRLLALALFVTGGIVLSAAAHWVLLAFGVQYSLHGTGCLVLLAIAVLPIAACNWAWTVLRLVGRLGALVLSTFVYAAAICSGAWFLAGHGLDALTAAWPLGAGVGAIVATIATAALAKKAPARHRRTAVASTASR
jgi:O-antigen/teichoic acid export membrane protein